MGQKFRQLFRNHKHLSLTFIVLFIGLGLRFGDFMTASDWILGSVAAISILPLAWHAYQELRIRRVDPNIIAIAATITAFALNEPLIAISIILVTLVRKLLAEYAHRRASRELDKVVGNTPQSAHLLRGRKETEVAASEVHPGHRLVIKPGEIVPVDGVAKDGSFVASGTHAKNEIILRATADADQSQMQRLLRMVQRAGGSSGSPFTHLAERYVPLFMLASFILAGACWYFSDDPHRFLAVLVVAVPSYLILGTPLAMLASIGRLAEQNVFVRSGTVLERLATVRSIMLGTAAKLVINKIATQSFPARTTVGEKIRLVETAQERPSAYVGANDIDTPLLTAADIGIALGSAGPLVDAADVIILSGKASQVASTIKAARRTFKLIQLSVFAGLLLSLALQILFATGRYHILAGVALQLLVDIVVIMTALRARN